MMQDGNYLLQTITKACSQNPIDLKDAESKIHQLEIQPGYCVNLLAIITNYTVNSNIRCMACVCLKNAVDRFWRKTAPNSIKEEERQLLKSQFLNYLNEPELKIARQMSVILGKLARFELPLQWPDLISKLLQILQETSAKSGNTNTSKTTQQQNLINSRCLMALHAIIKSLASKRLSNDRKIFEELSSNIIEMINQMAFSYIQECLVSNLETNETLLDAQSAKPQLQEFSFFLDQAILCLKILHKLVLQGFRDNTDSPALSQLIINLMQSFEKLIQKYNNVVNNKNKLVIDYFKEKYEYLLVLYVQIITDYQETYPFNFIQTCMNESFNVIIQVCFTPQGKVLSFPKLTINLMNFLKSIIMCDKYKQRLIKIDDQQIQMKQQKALELKSIYLTQENLQQILGFIFNEYLLMSDEELEQWQENPEEFINEDGTATDAWKYNYRACAETLFQAFVHEYHDLVVPIVVELIKNYSVIQPSDAKNVAKQNGFENGNSQSTSKIERYILLKDASYNCASIAAWELVTHVDFDVWFSQSLLSEIQNPECHILIKRRILILISNWVNIKMSQENRPLCYDLLCKCLQPTEDFVIRLQAALTLKAVMDDTYFEKETYLPYLNFHFGLLCQLLKSVEDSDTKIKVLGVLSFLIERVDIHIRPFSAQLADYLPFLWQESADHNMLRCCIVTAFHHLVRSFGAQSINYHPFLIPVIHYSTDSSNPASVYLLEDGLELWNITIQNSLQMSPDLLNLFSNIKPLLDRDTDIWKLCLEIIDSYVVLDCAQLFQFYGEFLIGKYCDLLNETIKIDALLRMMRSVGHMFETPINNIQLQIFEPFILKAMSLALNPEVYPMIMAMCLSMLAKPVLQDSAYFLKIVEKCAAHRNSQPENSLGELLDSWIDKIDMIVHPERRKLTALALISMLRFNSNVIYERFGAIINLCVTVMLDVLKEDNGVKYDCLVMSRDVENDDEEVDTEHEKRKRRLRLCDPVYSVSLKDYCLENLRECERCVGVNQFQQLMSSVDKTVSLKLNELLGC